MYSFVLYMACGEMILKKNQVLEKKIHFILLNIFFNVITAS